MDRQLELLQKVVEERESPLKAISVALVSALVTLALQGYINTFLPGPYFFLFFPVAAGVAWTYGFRASLFTVILLVVGSNYFFLEPKFAFGFGSLGENLALGFAGAASAFTGWVVSKLTSIGEAAAKAKTAEENLDESQRLLDQIFDEAPAYMVIVSYPELEFVRANDAYQVLVGRKDIVGKKVTDVLPRYEADGLATLVKRVAESKERFTGVEVPITITKPGEEPRLDFFDFVYQPLLSADGKTYAILSQGTSVTEKVKARKSIEESKVAIENERENFRNL
ncbi:MAG: DUF4118 domain-containing protein, partial [Bdellovibrionota bacterium]